MESAILDPLNPPDAFFVTGGTMRPDAASYIPRRADSELYEALMRGDLCYILNARQMGKSSLCARTIARLQEAGFQTVFLDLTRFGGKNTTAEQWYLGLLAETGRSLGLRKEFLAYAKENSAFSPLERFFGVLETVGLPNTIGPLIIFVDEIDAVRSLSFSTDEFFLGIREAFNRRAMNDEYRRLTFCLMGTATPAELISDSRITPFNIGRRIELNDFTHREAEPLSHALGDDAQATLDRILHWTGGHPYLTQRLCKAASEIKALNGVREVDRLTEAMFLSQSRRDSDDNLTLVRDRLLRADCDLYALLSLYRRVWREGKVADEETDPLCDVLKLSGVCRVDGPYLEVRNEIYRCVFDDKWINEHLPGVEMRRQKEAYRKGVRRTTTYASGIGFVMLGLIAFAFEQRYEAQKGRDEARTLAVQEKLSRDKAERETQIAKRMAQTALEMTNRANESGKAKEDALKLKDSALQEKENAIRIANAKENLAQTAAQREAAARQKERISKQTAERASQEAKQNLRDRIASDNTVASERRKAADLLVQKETSDLQKQLATAEAQRQATEAKNAHLLANLNDSLRKAAVLQLESAKSVQQEHDARNNYLLKMASIRDAYAGGQFLRVHDLLTETKDIGRQSFEWGCWNRLCRSGAVTLTDHKAGVLTVAFSPDGKRLLTGGRDNALLPYDVSDRRLTTPIHPLDRWSYPQWVRQVAFSPNGAAFAVATSNNSAQVRKIDGPGPPVPAEVMLSKHNNSVTCIAYSPDGAHIATGSLDKTVRLWDAATGKAIMTIPARAGVVNCLAFSRDGILGVGYGGKVIALYLVSGDSYSLVREIKREDALSSSIAFSHDGRTFATSHFDKIARVWDTATGTLIFALPEHIAPVLCVAFSYDDSRIATGGTDGTLRLWDTATGRQTLALDTGQIAVNCVAFSPNDKCLISGGEDGSVKAYFADFDLN